MNSSELQKNFFDVYKAFFNTHDIVIDGNSILTWWADISHGISTLRIKQKLPTKIYCAANFNTSGRVTFGNIFQYNALKNAYGQETFNIFSPTETERTIRFLEDFLSKNGFSSGIEIDILTEVPRWHGFASVCVLSVLFAFLLYIATGKLDTKSLPGGELPADHPLFEGLYAFSLNLSNCLSHGKSVGASNFAVMLPKNPLPIVYFSKKNANDSIYNEGTPNENHVSNDIYKGGLLDFLWIKDSADIESLPLDYGILFTGLEYAFSEIESMRERAKKREDRLNAFGTEIIESLPIKDEEKSIILSLLSFDKNEFSRKSIDNANLKILEWFDYLLKNTYDDNGVDECIKNIKSIGMLSFSAQKENKLFFSLQCLFQKYRQFETEEIGILPFNTGKIWGSLFFVMKYKESRETLQKVLNHLQSEGHITFLDYASWRDGSSSDGVRLEQFVTEKLYSEYTKEGDVLFSDSFGRGYFGDYNSIIENEKDCMLLDTIGGRIYLCGTKLTSKEIHSQNTTIDMFKILLENMGKEVSNSKLPVSTYSQNKNEILGKVVLPIRKLAKEHFWKDISLSCSGGITDYFLRLDRDDGVRIGIIKKLKN